MALLWPPGNLLHLEQIEVIMKPRYTGPAETPNWHNKYIAKLKACQSGGISNKCKAFRWTTNLFCLWFVLEEITVISFQLYVW